MEDEKNVLNSNEEKGTIGDEKKQEIYEQDAVSEEDKDGELKYPNTDDKDTDANDLVSNSSSSNKGSFFNNLTASVVDTAVVSIISVVLLYLTDIIMRNTIGLYITDKITFLFIIFVIISVLYPCIMNTTKGYTVGASVVKGKR